MADSALSPRDIQARIRGGASVADVAEAAGVAAEHIEPFAAPVIAERQHVAGSALACPVRRRGESSSSRSLRQVARERLQDRGIDIDAVEWDAWRDDDRRWHVTGQYSADGEHVAELLFDQRARFSTAANEEGRWLIGEVAPSPTAAPDPDSEPTVDLDDELAIVRAVQEPDQPRSGVTVRQQSVESFRQQRGRPRPDPSDYTEAELAAVDGVYDIVPPASEMDVLYEMLSGFNEDSVKIYAGLNQPVVDEQIEDDPSAAEQAPTTEAVRVEVYEEYVVLDEASEPTRRIPKRGAAQGATAATPVPASPQAEATQPTKSAGTRRTSRRAEAREPETSATPEAAVSGGPAPTAASESAAAPIEARDRGKPRHQSPSEPEQEALVDAPPPRPRHRKRRRAQVPTWDEIMFGGPGGDKQG